MEQEFPIATYIALQKDYMQNGPRLKKKKWPGIPSEPPLAKLRPTN
ncbi:hypothetical protein SAMN05428949_6760 [Chitinophaga sp. YR627]|nr:hypothetical protein SAMN05428949_6760 [Chitinophaga sp. YR627]